MGILDRIKHAWNAFIGLDPPNSNSYNKYIDRGPSFSYRPDKITLKRGTEKSIVGAIYSKIAIDCASVDIRHVELDDNKRYKCDTNDGINECLSVEANKDQTARMFIRDVVMSLFDEGCVAIVPIDTASDLTQSNITDIFSMRVGKIIQWYPDYVMMEVYNDKTGHKVNLTLPKNRVAIIENPLSAIMNEPNSTLQRLIHKLALLDVIDEQTGSGKLDLIIQLPYVIKTDARRKQANERSSEIEDQLRNSKYGIAYTDGTERITQLNRPVENNLMSQIEYLTSMLYSQLGITETILNGTADEKTMLNYLNRTVKPILDAIVDEMKRKFLTKTVRSKGHTIMYFSDPFKLVPVSQLADIADKFTRNEIMSSNEIRQIIGLKPVDDPKADELRNKNLNPPNNDGNVPEEKKDDINEANPEAKKDASKKEGQT